MTFFGHNRLAQWLMTLTVMLSLRAEGGTDQLDFSGKWFFSHGREKEMPLTATNTGEVNVELGFPGNALVWQERDRKELRPDRDKFRHRFLQMEIMMEGVGAENIRGVFFVKDKDGYWFQTPESFTLEPGKWQQVKSDLSINGGDLVPVGHTAAWNSLFATGIHAAGISLFSKTPGQVKLYCRPLRYAGDVKRPELSFRWWRLVDTGIRNEMFESRFALSREYFNPYDPDEIKIDVEAIGPDGKSARWPAFYSQDFSRKIFCNREQTVPQGSPFWAFRMTPRLAGEYRVRLLIADHSAKPEATLTTPWRTLNVQPSVNPGFVRVSPRDHRYFEFENGGLFYPIGMNIHTNIDVRSEKAFGFGHIPDHGTFDYDMYFGQMKKYGMNVVEIWMASWTYAVEWSSSCQNYYGLGRYSLANAWRLDYVLDTAGKHGIYVHLVLDNHGKMSHHSDQEWNESPFNKKHPFAVANGGFIQEPTEYFSSAEAWRYTRARDRYIAGRWGSFTSIMGIELWSESNLVTDFDKIYNNDVIVKWHAKTAAALAADDPGHHPITTHFCGDYENNLKYKKLEDLPEITYIVGDAYRDAEIPFYELMTSHHNALQHFQKPMWITEFGGTWGGGNDPILKADIKTALWSSLFKRQAGAPMTWWHDFVHRRNLYYLYQAFARYMQGVDPRCKNFDYLNLPVIPAAALAEGRKYPGNAVIMARLNSAMPGERGVFWSQLAYTGGGIAQWLENVAAPSVEANRMINWRHPENDEYPWRCFAAGGGNEAYGWVFFRPAMRREVESNAHLKPFTNMLMPLDFKLNRGNYRLVYYDTNTGKATSSSIVDISGSALTVITLPPFTTDIAFKLIRILPPGPYRLTGVMEAAK